MLPEGGPVPEVAAGLRVGEDSHVVGEPLPVETPQGIRAPEPLDPPAAADLAVGVQGHGALQGIDDRAVGDVEARGDGVVAGVGEGVALEVDLLEEQAQERVAGVLVAPLLQQAAPRDRRVVPGIPAQAQADEAGDAVDDAIGRSGVEVVGALTPPVDVRPFEPEAEGDGQRTVEVAQQVDDQPGRLQNVVVVVLVDEVGVFGIGQAAVPLAVVGQAVVARSNIPLVARPQAQSEAGPRDVRHLEAQVADALAPGGLDPVHAELVAVRTPVVVGDLQAPAVVPAAPRAVVDNRQARDSVGRARQHELPPPGHPPDRVLHRLFRRGQGIGHRGRSARQVVQPRFDRVRAGSVKARGVRRRGLRRAGPGRAGQQRGQRDRGPAQHLPGRSKRARSRAVRATSRRRLRGVIETQPFSRASRSPSRLFPVRRRPEKA